MNDRLYTTRTQADWLKPVTIDGMLSAIQKLKQLRPLPTRVISDGKVHAEIDGDTIRLSDEYFVKLKKVCDQGHIPPGAMLTGFRVCVSPLLPRFATEQEMALAEVAPGGEGRGA